MTDQTTVLPDLREAANRVRTLVAEFFPGAQIETQIVPMFFNYYIGAIGPTAKASVTVVSIPASVMDTTYIKRLETVRHYGRLGQEHLLKRTASASLKDVTFVDTTTARVVFDAQKQISAEDERAAKRAAKKE